MKNKLLIFIPHIGGGGVDKNFFMLSNFLSKKINSKFLDSSFILNNKDGYTLWKKEIKLP